MSFRFSLGSTLRTALFPVLLGAAAAYTVATPAVASAAEETPCAQGDDLRTRICWTTNVWDGLDNRVKKFCVSITHYDASYTTMGLTALQLVALGYPPQGMMLSPETLYYEYLMLDADGKTIISGFRYVSIDWKDILNNKGDKDFMRCWYSKPGRKDDEIPYECNTDAKDGAWMKVIWAAVLWQTQQDGGVVESVCYKKNADLPYYTPGEPDKPRKHMWPEDADPPKAPGNDAPGGDDDDIDICGGADEPACGGGDLGDPGVIVVDQPSTCLDLESCIGEPAPFVADAVTEPAVATPDLAANQVGQAIAD